MKTTLKKQIKINSKIMEFRLNEAKANQIMELLNELPIKSTSIVQKIVSVINECVVKEEEPIKKETK